MVENRYIEVIVVGGGPAGLSGALVLGRCRREVIVFDSEEYRNEFSTSLYGFLSRDGIDLHDFRAMCRQQVDPYNVRMLHQKVVAAKLIDGGFELTISDGEKFRCRKLLLATGIRDEWPTVPGIRQLYGKYVFPCPYCDGWEFRNQTLVVYSKDHKHCYDFAKLIRSWNQLPAVWMSDGIELNIEVQKALNDMGFDVRTEPIANVEESCNEVEIFFSSGPTVKAKAMFFSQKCFPSSTLAMQLGCELDEKGGVKVRECESVNVRNLYIAGDLSRDVLLAIVAAGEGAQSAVAIHKSLIRDEKDGITNSLHV